MPPQEDDIEAGESSYEVQPGESSSNDDKLKRLAIEEGIPIGEFRKDEKGKRRSKISADTQPPVASIQSKERLQEQELLTTARTTNDSKNNNSKTTNDSKNE
ncbi:hypothetical protein V501_06798 [Pseudogymnoascus sp. VKM F-4519 (FW-2642)]|nr:hypothetical protein V501_06798 [Pseudogymnoascus sp. VKM F-4519 (FW-2642)]